MSVSSTLRSHGDQGPHYDRVRGVLVLGLLFVVFATPLIFLINND
jgi:hypothetical protein